MNSIKNALKKVFPRNFLKKVYRIFKKTRVAVVDPVLFGEHHVDQNDFRFYRKGFPFKDNDVDASTLNDRRVKKFMGQWYDWTQEEFILEVSDAIIEPDHGWAIMRGRKLLYYSLGISRTWFLPKPKFFKYLFRKKILRAPAVISFRDTGEENYFHFFNDVLAKFFFLQSHGIDFTGRQVVISKKLHDKPYFQWYFKQAKWLAGLKFIVQNGEYVAASSAIFCKPLTHRKDLLAEVFKPVVGESLSAEKIFVARSRRRMRYIENSDEVATLFATYGFNVVDPDNLSPDQQREIFSGAAFIAGVHGAALTNMYFRAGSCNVLEIFPPPEEGYLPFHYIMLAKMKGFLYQAVIGEGESINLTGGFAVDVQSLEAVLHKMLQHE